MANASTESMPVTMGTKASGSQDMFNRELETYRRIVGANLMFHREVYDVLRDLLVEQAPASFRFLDVACGDASASAAMLKTTAIGSYVASTYRRRRCDWRLKPLKASLVPSNSAAAISRQRWRNGRNQLTSSGSACRCTICRRRPRQG